MTSLNERGRGRYALSGNWTSLVQIKKQRAGCGHGLDLISRKFRAIAFWSMNEIIQSTGHASSDLAFISKERVTLVSLPTRSKSHVSSIRVANRESGAEKSFICIRIHWVGFHSTISSMWLDPSRFVTRIREPKMSGVLTSN